MGGVASLIGHFSLAMELRKKARVDEANSMLAKAILRA